MMYWYLLVPLTAYDPSGVDMGVVGAELWALKRQEGEEFIQTVRRAGLEPFKAGFTAYIASRQAATEAAE